MFILTNYIAKKGNLKVNSFKYMWLKLRRF